MKDIEYMHELWKRNLLKRSLTSSLDGTTRLGICDVNCVKCFECHLDMYNMCQSSGTLFVSKETYDEFYETYPEAFIVKN